MSAPQIIEELIRAEDGGALSFGNHLSEKKLKLRDFEVSGNVYNLKTFNEITKLEKNESLLFEAVPGATVHNFTMSEDKISFTLYGIENTQIILELEPSSQYNVSIDGDSLGSVKTTMSGKLVFSAELGETAVTALITKSENA